MLDEGVEAALERLHVVGEGSDGKAALRQVAVLPHLLQQHGQQAGEVRGKSFRCHGSTYRVDRILTQICTASGTGNMSLRRCSTDLR